MPLDPDGPQAVGPLHRLDETVVGAADHVEVVAGHAHGLVVQRVDPDRRGAHHPGHP